MSELTSSGLQIQTTFTSAGKVELQLVDVPTPVPKADEVLVRVEAAPINPSDLNVLFGFADMKTVQVDGAKDDPLVTLDMPAGAVKLLAAAGRVGEARPSGIEGAGVVIAAGQSKHASDLLGKTVAFMGQPSYSQYRCIGAEQCMVLPEDVTPAEAASSFVNPLTVMGMVETMRMEGHRALVHTVGASNLGKMLVKHCRNEGVELVNIVRKPEQVALLHSLGAKYVCCSSSSDFTRTLTEALVATGATLAFDAIGGGKLASQILGCMEVALVLSGERSSDYGTAVHKQVYIYGGLDRTPTTIQRTSGMAWGVGGWLLQHFLERIGPQKARALKSKVASEIKTTFASNYTKVISLREALTKEAIEAYSRQATGEKYLINPNMS